MHNIGPGSSRRRTDDARSAAACFLRGHRSGTRISLRSTEPLDALVEHIQAQTALGGPGRRKNSGSDTRGRQGWRMHHPRAGEVEQIAPRSGPGIGAAASAGAFVTAGVRRNST